MKAIRFASALSVVALLLGACTKDAPMIKHPVPPQTAGKTDVRPFIRPIPVPDESDAIWEDTYNSLGLVPLDIDQAGLPPIPKPRLSPVYPRDKALDDLEAGYPGYVKIGAVIIPKYGKPVGFTLGEATNPWEVNRDVESYIRHYRHEAYGKSLVLTFAFEPSEQYAEPHTGSRRKSFLFDSLNRVHQVGPPSPRAGLLPYTPMPYDLRKLIVAHEGVDISPLFYISYHNYTEAARLGDFSKAVTVRVRVSEMTMKDLDWIYGGLFRLYPLTEDYPSFTLIGIRKDGTIFKRDLRYPLD